MSFGVLVLVVGGLVVTGAIVVDYFSRPQGHDRQKERRQH